MELRFDDALYRVTGRWIESRGTPMGGFRYAAWGFAVPSFIALYVFLMPTIGFVAAVMYSGGIAALIGKLGADQIGGEYTVRAWTTLIGSEARTMHRHREEWADALNDWVAGKAPTLRHRRDTPIRYNG